MSSPRVPTLRFPRNLTEVTLVDVDETELVVSTFSSLSESGMGESLGDSASEGWFTRGNGFVDALGD